MVRLIIAQDILSVVQTYALISAAPYEEIEVFYDSWEMVLRLITKSDIAMVRCDFILKVGHPNEDNEHEIVVWE